MKTFIIAFALVSSAYTAQAALTSKEAAKFSEKHDTAVKTADSQMRGTKSDVELTRKIRDRITNEESLSTSAQNINIVTLGNSVTLKGEVENKAEITKLAAIAKELAGSKMVNTELTVTK